jgi:hypothetical protein
MPSGVHFYRLGNDGSSLPARHVIRLPVDRGGAAAKSGTGFCRPFVTHLAAPPRLTSSSMKTQSRLFRAKVRSVGALVAFLAFASFSSPLGAQVLREEFWVPDSPVSDIAVANGAVYLAGEFMQVGPATGAFVGLDAATGATLQPFPEVDGVVLAVADDGAGGWYIGGSFTSVQGQPRNHLARLDASGQVTGWNPDSLKRPQR